MPHFPPRSRLKLFGNISERQYEERTRLHWARPCYTLASLLFRLLLRLRLRLRFFSRSFCLSPLAAHKAVQHGPAGFTNFSHQESTLEDGTCAVCKDRCVARLGSTPEEDTWIYIRRPDVHRNLLKAFSLPTESPSASANKISGQCIAVPADPRLPRRLRHPAVLPSAPAAEQRPFLHDIDDGRDVYSAQGPPRHEEECFIAG